MKHNSPDISIRAINKNDVELFRDIRLKALLDSPESFGQKHDDEVKKPLHYWQDLVDKVTPPNKNTAFILFKGKKPIGVIFGFVKENQQGSFGGMWIDPNY